MWVKFVKVRYKQSIRILEKDDFFFQTLNNFHFFITSYPNDLISSPKVWVCDVKVWNHENEVVWDLHESIHRTNIWTSSSGNIRLIRHHRPSNLLVMRFFKIIWNLFVSATMSCWNLHDGDVGNIFIPPCTIWDWMTRLVLTWNYKHDAHVLTCWHTENNAIINRAIWNSARQKN